MINSCIQYGNDYRKQESYDCTRRTFISGVCATFLMGKYLTPNFTIDELSCRGTGVCRMDENFLELLQQIRNHFGKPMVVTSGYRHPDYNEKVSKTGRTGPHTKGQAVDVLITGKDAIKLFAIAQNLGMTGIGLNQRGPHNKRFIHMDNLPDIPGKQPRPHCWTY